MKKINIFDVRKHPGDSAFLIDDGQTSILYDSGFGFTGDAVAENIKAKLGQRSLDYIFLTHSHYDHALGSAYILKHYPDAKVVAGQYAATIFNKPSAKNLMRILDRKFAEQCGISQYEDLTDNLKVDIPVKDGDIINAGDMTFTAMNLPGHTKCSMGYYMPENKLLLSCETIGVYGGENIVVPSYLVGYSMTLASIEKASTLDIQSILIPHFGVLDKSDATKYIDAAKMSAVDTAEKISTILKSGGTKTQAIDYFKDKFFHGYIKTIYPPDALELNTSIMVDLIDKEL